MFTVANSPKPQNERIVVHGAIPGSTLPERIERIVVRGEITGSTPERETRRIPFKNRDPTYRSQTKKKYRAHPRTLVITTWNFKASQRIPLTQRHPHYRPFKPLHHQKCRFLQIQRTQEIHLETRPGVADRHRPSQRHQQRQRRKYDPRPPFQENEKTYESSYKR